MQQVPSVGTFDFEVFSAGRRGRSRSSRFQLRCDAVGLYEDEMLLLSVIGAETGVKALTAGLRSSVSDQRRIEYSVHVGPVNRTRLSKCANGYRVYRTKLAYGLWHVLCLGQREGFLPAVTDESLWQLLLADRFTTPLLRDWIPWLREEMKRRGSLVELTTFGCQAGLLLADGEALDALVSDGIKSGCLRIAGRAAHARQRVDHDGIKNLDEYLLAYGGMLGKQAERSLDPLHVPGRDPLPDLDLLRDPFDAQAHVIEAARKALRRQKALLLVGEMGTGKTIMGVAACHAHAVGRPYRGLVFCPGQLVNKWEREIRETIPGTEVIQIEGWRAFCTWTE